MNKINWLILAVVVILITLTISSRLNIQNNISTIEVVNNKEMILFVGDSITD